MKKPDVGTMQYIDYSELFDWCEKVRKLDISDLMVDLEAGNDSYCFTTIEDLHKGWQFEHSSYAPKLAQILQNEFGIKDKIAFWVCW